MERLIEEQPFPQDVEIKKLLERLGFTVAIGNQKETTSENLVDIVPGGGVHCIDGRVFKDETGKLSRGPKLPGGVLGVAALIMKKSGERDANGKKRKPMGFAKALGKAIALVGKSGFTPVVHGDGHSYTGCGFLNVWYQRSEELKDYLPPIGVPVETAIGQAEKGGASYVKLEGSHQEEHLIVNLVHGKTLVPDGSAFILDPVNIVQMFDKDNGMKKLGITVGDVVELAVRTIKALDGCQKAKIITG
jgi:hypothetical protein